jgi:hypothetical protein
MTNDVLDHADSFEKRLRDGLHHIALTDPVPDPGRFNPDVMSVEQPGGAPSARWFAGVAATVVVAFGVGALVVLVRNDRAPSTPADRPATEAPAVDSSVSEDGSSATAPTVPLEVPFDGASLFGTPLDAGRVPVVIFDGAATTYAYSQSYPGPFGGGFAGATVLVPDDASFDTPRLAIDVVERSAANGNETYDLTQSGEPIEVAGTTGYLSTESTDFETGEEGPIHLLFFDLDASRFVRVNAAGMGVEEMVSIVNTYDPATGTVDVPDGYRVWPMPDHDINHMVEFTFDLGSSEVGLHGSSRGAEFLLGELGNSVTSTQVIDGVEVSLRSSVDKADQWSAFWIDGDWSFRANFNVDDPATIAELLGRFRLVDDATFAGTFAGGEVVTDSTRAAEVGAMLGDVELPPALDVGDLTDRRGANARYQEIAAVSGAVACSWLDVYFGSIDADPSAAQAAADALAASTEWDMLTEISDQGGWSSAVWGTAAAVSGDGTIATGAGEQAPSRENTYPGLGCDTR